jgi:heterodisulfide reductase subunit B
MSKNSGETPMEYLYYPGCSLESAGRPYDESLRAVFHALGVQLEELDDWNCCGATMYMSIDEPTSLAISARNLALAAQDKRRDLVAPCSACYTVLLKTNRFLRDSPELKTKVDQILGRVGLRYDLSVNVRHPLDVLVNDVGVDTIAQVAKRNLGGFPYAPYYGCQIVRPERGFDDPEYPTKMDTLFEKLGAKAVYFPMKTRCCGGMLMTTSPEVALQLVKELLECAVENGAQAVVTTCPMCQVNVEAYQKRVNKRFGTSFDIPVLFFTQLLGLALGCSEKELGRSWASKGILCR